MAHYLNVRIFHMLHMTWATHFHLVVVTYFPYRPLIMIFLNSIGDLNYFLPLSYLLSWRGAKSLIADMGALDLAPELESSLEHGVGLRDSASADVYAVAAVVFRSLTGARSTKGHDQSCKLELSALSAAGSDFFHRVLYKDLKWRMPIDDAIKHRWCNGNDAGSTIKAL